MKLVHPVHCREGQSAKAGLLAAPSQAAANTALDFDMTGWASVHYITGGIKHLDGEL